MNKSELIEQVADRADIKRSEAEAAVNALTEVVKETLQRGGDVAITGFGKFSVAERGARQGVNPQTGERIQIAASKAPKFSAGADFKKALKGT
ncbi:MAG TPA: HU family DNA-binding protein [Thermoleophilaceae bacterium]